MASGVKERRVEILLVEDNPGDVRLTQEPLPEAKVRNRLAVAEDGLEALAYLRREGRYSSEPRPDIIFLDLNLPRLNGWEVLEEMKGDPVLRRIPVVILTTSDAEEDVLKSYDLHANCYVKKPVDFEAFMQVIRAIEGFWLTAVRLPNGV